MPALTTTYDMKLPSVGGDTDTWGGYLNENFNALDAWFTNTFDSPSIDPATGHLGTIKNARLPSSMTGKTFSSAVTLPTGLALTFTGDTDTGFGRSGAGVAAIYADSASARVFVSSTSMSLTVGLQFGSTVAPGGATDLSRHLDLYGAAYGISVTGANMNFVSPTSTAQNFYIDGNERFSINGTDARSYGPINFNGVGLTFDHTADRTSVQVAASGIISIQGAAATGASIAVINLYHGANNNTLQIRRNGAIFNTTGTMGVLSDPDAKDEITPASAKLDDINRLDIINYRLRGKGREYGKLLGFHADNVMGVFPGLVEIDEESGYKVVKWSVLVPMLVKAVQELSAKVKRLEARP